MNLTTLARVKARCGIAAGTTTQDDLLNDMIAEVSVQVSNLLRRETETKERTETLRMSGDTRKLLLPAYPVTSLSALRNASKPVFVGVDVWTVNEDFFLDPDIGEITVLADPEWILDDGGAPLAPTFFQATWIGGMGEDTDDFIANFPDIAGAVDEQVRYLYQRKDALGGNAETSNGRTTFMGAYDLLESVVKRVTYHTREM